MQLALISRQQFKFTDMKETYSPTEISSGSLQQAELFNFAKIAGDNSEKPLHTHPGPDPVPTHPGK